uniref:Uncharacterized protein n=1 Tax=Anabas testudineus TaxID=64144 RepID=A0A7N6FAL7_ANATE
IKYFFAVVLLKKHLTLMIICWLSKSLVNPNPNLKSNCCSFYFVTSSWNNSFGLTLFLHPCFYYSS